MTTLTGPNSKQIVHVAIDRTGPRTTVSDTLFGLFFEDINFGLDGGLNANLVNNYSFDGVYLDREGNSLVLQVMQKGPGRPQPDGSRNWRIEGGRLTLLERDRSGAHYANVTSSTTATLINNGYPGYAPGMGARKGVGLRFDAEIRAMQATAIEVRLRTGDGRVVAESSVPVPATEEWTTAAVDLMPTETALVRLEIVISGSIDLDEIRLVPHDHWGAHDPRWSQGVLRRDLVEALRDLKPTFLRFPGGCVVEGLDLANAYNWKRTIGPLRGRRGDYNLWALDEADGNYAQSNQIGFYEYFLLCEDLGIEPIPVINAGIACQMRSHEIEEVDGTGFDATLQDAIDLVEWATGDPGSSSLAALRADAGHPDPFVLRTIGIGNENFGPEYTERFGRIRRKLEQHIPELRFILSAGTEASGDAFDHSWAFARQSPDRTIVDEHYYQAPSWFFEATTRYDDYPRESAKVFVGEYAAFAPTMGLPVEMRAARANSLETAIAEAAFYTGLVRNSDVVTMSSYAPLLNLVEHGHWEHDFINFNPFTVRPTLNYWAQWLFSSAIGREVVQMSGELPEGVFGVSTIQDSLTITHLVNSTAASVHVELDLGLTTIESARVSTLNGKLNDVLPLGYTDANSGSSPIATRLVSADRGILRAKLPRHSIVRIVA